ncbi:MAG: hypothetical protein ACR2RE_17025 [Geminicoccaceae bacterium]
MPYEKSTFLWRISFDRGGNVVANGKHPVGRVTHVLENGIWFGSFMWDGEFYEARAKSKEHLLSELRAEVGLTPKEVPATATVN